MSDHNQPQEIFNGPEFIEDFTEKAKSVYDSLGKGVEFLQTKYSLHPNQATRMLLAAVVTAGTDNDCTDTDILNFTFALFSSVIKQVRLSGEAEGIERFPIAKVFPEARLANQIPQIEAFNANHELTLLSENLNTVILTALDTFCIRHNICGYDTYISMLAQLISNAFLSTSPSQDSFNYKVDFLRNAMLRSWDTRKEDEQAAELPN